MALWIHISPGSKEPIYAQIYEQISQAVAKGDLNPGEKLPPVRVLAAELVINPNTVARAYTQLEQAGLVGTKTGAGTFVRFTGRPILPGAPAGSCHGECGSRILNPEASPGTSP